MDPGSQSVHGAGVTEVRRREISRRINDHIEIAVEGRAARD